MNDLENVIEELFCVNYETKLFAQYVSYGKLERWIPGFSDNITEECHITRYEFVADFVKDKSVLDIACGTGKGSFMIAEAGAARVTGVDIDEEAVRYAEHRSSHAKLSFHVGDAIKYSYQDLYDVVVSFETIEHLDNVSGFLENMNNLLKEDGVFFVSTPISAQPVDTKPKNKYHIQEWGFDKFQEVVSEFLIVEESFLQLFPKSPYKKLHRYWNRIFGPNNGQDYISTIYKTSEINKKKDIPKLGKLIKGYQILKCRKK